ncbi:T9SS type A sorting domain-containing protein [Hymenobacter sp. CRA2]|uniref:T9SS type A sorting domain-containing protein n=1 Tax=Hymenobacter sp. CRA2 TaxID=1955620 RepID=UPI0009CAEEFF|nr:T9SS type A sorting domain-containing protein [Hymenobacter sp. CRA2]OON68987.1 hypothetical protein B0919_09745 [Hymenobacter sp. CRA2]
MLLSWFSSNIAQAQAVGDYRSIEGVANFATRSGWQRWNGSAWVANSTALNFAKTFTVRHTKTITLAGLATPVGRIAVTVDMSNGTTGVLTVNGPVTCAALEISGDGAQVLAKSDLMSVGTTYIDGKGLMSLRSDADLGSITVENGARIELTAGVGINTAIGPITVDNGGTLSVSSSGATISGLQVAAGGQVLINADLSLAKARVETGGLLVQQANGAITVLHDASASGDLTVEGQLRNENSTAAVTLANMAVMRMRAGAWYTHSANGGELPTCDWDPASTLQITGVVDASGFGNDGQTFGNVTWDTPNYGSASTGSNIFYLNSSGNMVIAGKLLVLNTGRGQLQLTPPAGNGTATTYIGSYEQLSGLVCLARSGASLTRTATIGGDFTLTSGRFELSNSSSSGPGVLNVGGNMTLSAGTLLMSGGTASGTLNLSGDMTLQSGSDLRWDAGAGLATIRFAGTTVQNFSRAGSAAINGKVDFEVQPRATLNVADQIIDGDGRFTLNAGAALRIGHTQGITVNNPNNTVYRGNIQVTGTRTYDANATYVYAGTGIQQTGTGLPAALGAGAELALDNSAGAVTLSRATSLAGELRLHQGRLLTASAALTLTPAATWSEASNASYVDGPLERQTNSNAQVYTFPVGANGRLKVGGVRPGANSNATFRMVAFAASAPDAQDLAAGSDLYTVSLREYWTVTRISGSANANLRLYYTVPYSSISETPAAQRDLRIAAYQNGQWANYGQAALPNTTERYLDAGQLLVLTTNTATNVTFASVSARNPLPVSLVEFRARLLGNQNVQLNWRTAQEKDCAGFEIQSSDNGVDYRILDYYNGQGTVSVATSYSYCDMRAFSQGQRVRYYRLRQIDTNGQFAYSPVVSVAPTLAKGEPITAWPTPATDWLNIALSASLDESVTVRIFDDLGRLCQTQQYTAENVPAVARLPVDRLHRGLYFVQVETKQSRVQVRFQKE